VEIMVGMVIGMFGLIIMMQVFSLSEAQKRSTTGGGDATSAGTLALYGLQRDIRQAGYGFYDVNMVGCNVLLRPGVVLNAMAPLTINHAQIPAGDANTDTLLVVYGNFAGSPQGDGLLSSTNTPGINNYWANTPSMFAVNDRVIVTAPTRPNPCSVGNQLILDTVTVSNINPPNAGRVDVAIGVANMKGGILFNLGQSPKVVAYAVRGGNLTQCDYVANDCSAAGNVGNTTIWVPIGSNIVSLRAQYGRDTWRTWDMTKTPPIAVSPAVAVTSATANMDGVVDQYDQIAPATTTAATSAFGGTPFCDWVRISAVRMVLVARNAQPEKTTTDPVTGLPVHVTSANPTWEGSVANNPVGTAANPAGSVATPIDVSATTVPAGFTWQDFRYKVLQTTIPMRNVAWQGVAPGC
jgi:type IV pilus assembly protein PilW